MKTIIALFSFLVAVKGLSAAPPFVPSGRMLTITEIHGGTGVHWRCWVVSRDRLTVYDEISNGSYRPFVAAEVPLTEVNYRQLQKATMEIRSRYSGHAWRAKGAMDGLILRLSFSEDGGGSSQDIVVENLWRSEVVSVVQEVSALLPIGSKIGFEDEIKSGLNGYIPEVEKLSVEDFDKGR